jgi:hypothetical protein
MKVFTTAIFSVMILNRSLHLRKWRALLTLTLGVILISHEAMPKVSRPLRRPSGTRASTQSRTASHAFSFRLHTLLGGKRSSKRRHAHSRILCTQWAVYAMALLTAAARNV